LARAGRGDLHVRRDYRLAAADRRPHWLAEHRVDARAAELHLAVDPYNGAPGVSRSLSIAPASKSGRRLSTKRPAMGWSYLPK